MAAYGNSGPQIWHVCGVLLHSLKTGYIIGLFLHFKILQIDSGMEPVPASNSPLNGGIYNSLIQDY